MKLESKDLQVLQHLIEHCDNVQEDVEFIKTREALELDTRTQRSLICSILQIGELVNEELSLGFRASHKEIPWKSIIAMRHKLVHHYADRKLDIIWSSATESVPGLRRFLMRILSTDLSDISRLELK